MFISLKHDTVPRVNRDLKHQDGRDGRRLPGSEITPMSRTTHDRKAASSRPALVSDVKTDVLPSYVQRELILDFFLNPELIPQFRSYILL